jgi:hypothetical protein
MTYKILPLVISQVIRIMAKKKPHKGDAKSRAIAGRPFE